jgi:hypothetical protein
VSVLVPIVWTANHLPGQVESRVPDCPKCRRPFLFERSKHCPISLVYFHDVVFVKFLFSLGLGQFVIDDLSRRLVVGGLRGDGLHVRLNRLVSIQPNGDEILYSEHLMFVERESFKQLGENGSIEFIS